MCRRSGALVFGLLCVAVFLGCSKQAENGSGQVPSPPDPGHPAPPTTGHLFQARKGFTTTQIPNSYKPAPPAAHPPAKTFKNVHYTSPAGKLVAYLTPDPGDGKKHPAIHWAHGGFGGIGSSNWHPAGNTAPFRNAGFIVMCPAWRGENEN